MPKRAGQPAKAKRGPSRVEAAMDKLEKEGPYTLERAMVVARMCARSQEWQIGDLFDDIPHKFSPEELKKLIHWKEHVPPAERKSWCEGTGGYSETRPDGSISEKAWKLQHLTGELTDAHLDIIATVSDSNFDAILENVEVVDLSPEVRRRWLTDMREAAEKRTRRFELEYAKDKAERAAQREANRAADEAARQAVAQPRNPFRDGSPVRAQPAKPKAWNGLGKFP